MKRTSCCTAQCTRTHAHIQSVHVVRLISLARSLLPFEHFPEYNFTVSIEWATKRTSENWNKNATLALALFLYLLMDAEQKTKYKFICIAIHWKWSTSSSAPKDKWAKNCRRRSSSTVCLGYYTSNAIKKEQIYQPTNQMNGSHGDWSFASARDTREKIVEKQMHVFAKCSKRLHQKCIFNAFAI